MSEVDYSVPARRPTTGRIVRYREEEESESVPAIVVAVHGPATVSLNCFTMVGVVIETSMEYGDPDEGPFPCWYWPGEE